MLRFVLLFLFALLIPACSLQKDVNVKSIEIVEESVPSFIIVGEFDKAGIKALVTYDDNTTKIIEVNSNLLKDVYRDYINQAGNYEIEVLFKGKVTSLNVNIVNAESIHVVKFFNGLNEVVSIQYVEKGKDAIAPSGQAHIIEGYEFIGWDRVFTNVDEDINVYALYSKVNKEEHIDYNRILINASNNMRNNDLNVLDVWELSSKRIEVTNYYNDGDLNKVVKKVREANGEVNYNKYEKVFNEEGVFYKYEKCDGNGFYNNVNITLDEFSQFDIYNEIKWLINSTDNLNYSSMVSLNDKLYKLEAVIPNNGDGNHTSDTYELLFNEEQIIYIRHLLNYKKDTGIVEKVLTSTRYYTVNPSSEEKIVFPSEIDLFNITSSVYNNDVVITKEETRDLLVVVSEIKNDCDKKAALVTNGNVTTYLWDKEDATYYTKEELGSVGVQVYKTRNSFNRYGNEYYYKVKDLSNYKPNIFVNEDNSITFFFRINETSSERAHNIEFIVLNNKLIEYKKHYYKENEIVYIEKVSFDYKEVEVEVPSILLEWEANAIEE